ncbi:MAG TPA: hypothetical protein VGB28_03880 [Actinomycetota bacterium]
MTLLRTARRAAPAAALLLILIADASRAAPAPSLTVTAPTSGATISKAAGPFTASGTVGFTEPEASTTPLYLRYEALDGNNCGRRYLSETDGPDAGNSCQSTGAHTTLIGTSFTRDWPADSAEVGLPLTIDASRNITGAVNITSRALSFTGNPVGSPGNWVTLDVVVRLGTTALTQSFDSGPFAGSTHSFTINLDVPASLDKVDVSTVQVDLVWHRVIHLSQQGQSVVHTFAELDNPPTFVSVPTYTASFDRRVQLTVDNPSFSGSPIAATVDLGAGTFTASVPTASLSLGSRTLYARALQGGKPSATSTVPFTLTS